MLHALTSRLKQIFQVPTRAFVQIDSLMNQDKLQEAARLVEQLINRYGRRPELLFSSAKVQARLGNNPEVVRFLREIPLTPHVSTPCLFDSASMLMLFGDADSADRILQYLMREREHWHSALWIAQRDSRVKSHDSALDAFATVFTLGGEASWDLVIQSLQSCSNEAAQACADRFTKVKSTQQANPHYYKMLSLLDLRKGRAESSLENIRRATEVGFKDRRCEFRYDRDCLPLKPKFLIIGAMKCGTTTLYDLITQHPLCIQPMEKEIQFFQFPHLSDEWYLEHFPRVDKATGVFTGDASPGYYLYDVQNRIREMLPDIKILFIERDPAERAISHIKHNHRQGICAHDVEAALSQIDHLEKSIADDPKNAERTITELTFKKQPHNSYLVLGLYDLYLRRWKRLYGPEQLLTLSLENLQSSPQNVMNRVFEFLEVPSARINLQQINKGNYSKTDTKTVEVIERLRRFYETIKKLTSTYPDEPFSSQTLTDVKHDECRD